MGSPLTIGSVVQCGHAGVVAASGGAKLTIGGNAVLLATGIAGKTVASCATPPTPTTKPCVTVLTVLPPSQATKLTVGGQPVILDSLVGVTDGVPPGALLAIAGQAKLSAV